MSIGIVISTYNGSKYILEQLTSLINQTQIIDKVLILDDCSTDNTVSIVKKFIEKNNLSTWLIEVNEENVGWKINFWRGISLIDTDVIFLCDQDDIWMRDKVKIMTSIMQNKDITLLACGYTPYYGDDAHPIKINDALTRQMTNSGKIIKINFTPKFMYVDRPGCTYAVRHSLVELANNIWTPTVSHDGLLWRVSILTGGAYLLDRNLILWRRHGESATSMKQISKSSMLDKRYYNNLITFINPNIDFINSLLHFIKHDNLNLFEEKRNILEKELSFNVYRKKVYDERRVLGVIKLVFMYHDFYFSLRSILGEILIIWKMAFTR